MFIKSKNNPEYITGFHTQEHRQKELKSPVVCNDREAWLGKGYFYFWTEDTFAHYWGLDFKKKTGKYDVYMCDIDPSNLLDTAFNYEHYVFFLSKVEKAIKKLTLKGIHIDIETVHRWLSEEVWKHTALTGIVYCDTPTSSRYGVIKPLYYLKRIQIATFNTEIISNFVPYSIANKCA